MIKSTRNCWHLALINEERWDEVENLWDKYLHEDSYFADNASKDYDDLECIRTVFTEKHITDVIIDSCPKDRVMIHELTVSQDLNYTEPKALARLLEKVPDVLIWEKRLDATYFSYFFILVAFVITNRIY